MNAILLTRDFCTALRCTLTPTHLALVRERNRAEINFGICHSHDFCDANQVMLNAIEMQVPGYDFDPSDDVVMAAIDIAWGTAKSAGFEYVEATE